MFFLSRLLLGLIFRRFMPGYNTTRRGAVAYGILNLVRIVIMVVLIWLAVRYVIHHYGHLYTDNLTGNG